MRVVFDEPSKIWKTFTALFPLKIRMLLGQWYFVLLQAWNGLRISRVWQETARSRIRVNG